MSDFAIIGKGEHASVDDLLNAFHEAAALGDLNLYFGCFADEKSRFLGTDVNENWTASEFMTFAGPHFKGDGTPAWIYAPKPDKERILDYMMNGTLCTFDEHLTSESFGATSRGSGTAVKNEQGKWHLVHYYLSFPIPNDLAHAFCGSIAKWEGAKVASVEKALAQELAENEAARAADALILELESDSAGKPDQKQGKKVKKGKGK
jgi:hypothetical protein